MNGQLKIRIFHQTGYTLILLLLLAGGVLSSCLKETTASTSSAQPGIDGAAVPQPSPTPSVKTFIDISGCWQEVSLKDRRIPASTPFNIYKSGPNEFTIRKPPQKTKFVVSESLTFQEVNYDDDKPFLPKGTIFSSGNISPENDAIVRFISGKTTPHNYNRCQNVFNLPVQKPSATTEGTTEEPNPEASSTLPPLTGTPDQTAPETGSEGDSETTPVPPNPTATPTPVALAPTNSPTDQ